MHCGRSELDPVLRAVVLGVGMLLATAGCGDEGEGGESDASGGPATELDGGTVDGGASGDARGAVDADDGLRVLSAGS